MSILTDRKGEYDFTEISEIILLGTDNTIGTIIDFYENIKVGQKVKVKTQDQNGMIIFKEIIIKEILN